MPGRRPTRLWAPRMRGPQSMIGSGQLSPLVSLRRSSSSCASDARLPAGASGSAAAAGASSSTATGVDDEDDDVDVEEDDEDPDDAALASSSVPAAASAFWASTIWLWCASNRARASAY